MLLVSDDMAQTTAEDEETVELVVALRDTGNLHPLVARLRDGELGPERARDALLALADYDVELLVQLALDTLISIYVTDPGVAHQTRRETRGTSGDGSA
ncbi:MAG: hypothetical protein QOF76_2991 [Solirubrobacteraceae bacterium]|jgi:hypothetical protein|nr:hypothetical protein [Solirubrobacteraceae bacterium]